MDNCIFCKIANGAIPAEIIHQDDEVTAFYDIHPVTPIHILIIPNKHISSVNHLEPADEGLMGHMVMAAKAIARQQGIHESGYRLVMNTGPDAGQSVFHVHLHLLGGRKMPFHIPADKKNA